MLGYSTNIPELCVYEPCYYNFSELWWKPATLKLCLQIRVSAGLWCFDIPINGKMYQGHVSETVTGKPCQRWDAQEPHLHTKDAANFPDDNLADAADYCRNPDPKYWPWCFTMDASTRFEYCSIQDLVCRR